MAGKQLSIGLLGCGTVGRGLMELMDKNRALIRDRSGVDLQVSQILVRDLKKERPDQAHLLVSKHNPGETVIAQKQATGIQTKKILSKMLTTCSLFRTSEQKWHQASNRHPNQKNTEQNAHYLLTIQNQTKNMSTNLTIKKRKIIAEEI